MVRELLTKNSFRKSKTSHVENIDGREFFFAYSKAHYGNILVYDILTEVLILVSTRSIETTREWLLANMQEFYSKIKPYEKQERNLFS